MAENTEIELFVPGRLCLFGEHSDWAGRYTAINSEVVPGYAIVTGIDLGIYATAKKSNKFEMTTLDSNGNTVSFFCPMELKVLKEKAAENGYFCYACGVAAYLFEHYQIGGISIVVDKVTLPIKKGLSSSAAICVLVTRAFNELYKLSMSTNGEMQAAYRGEMLTSSRCGRLDQACAYGIRPVCIEFDGDEISVEKLKVGKDLNLVFADLMGKKETKKILSDLNKAYPFPQNDCYKNVHDALGIHNKEIIQKATEYIATGDIEAIGKLMQTAQELFDAKVAPACPEELTSPMLHKTLSNPVIKNLTFGGKGVGSQGDGMIQLIARDKITQKELMNYLNSLGMDAYSFTISAGEQIKKAIIPVAGFGTRMYPETHFVKKEFFPVVDENNIVKPVILCILEELDKAGIEEIILIIGEEEKQEFEKMFNSKLFEEHIQKLPENIRNYEQIIRRIGTKLKFAIQKERKGFGHAVYQAKQFLCDEPVLLLLGDFIYKSNLSTSCVQQTMNAYNKSGGQLTVAIKPIPVEDVVHYGIITGKFDDKRYYLMNATDIVEKPTVEYSKDYLGVKYQNSVQYFATFGQYVLTPEVFNLLEEDIAENIRTGSNNEIQLTSALQKVCKTSGMTGVVVDGKSYDIGIPKAYVETVSTYCLK